MEQPSTLDQLRALDEHVLSEVVRQDQRCPDFVLTSWQVERLSDKGIVNPDGLFRFSGMGYDPGPKEAARAWSVVLKILQAPEEEGDITNVWYWKRELLAVQSGLLEDLPEGGVMPPRFYGAIEKENSAWIWMEFVREIVPPRWPLSRFPEVARLVGRSNGAYLCGRPLPDYPWLSRDQGIGFGMYADLMGVLDNPIVQRLFSSENRIRLQRLWGERERFFQVYRALPQVFAHGDATRRNQLFRLNAEGREELVSIDWAWCGIAPVGWDLSILLADSTLLLDLAADDLPAAEEAAFPAYLDGLRSAGWPGDSRLARLGYCVSATLFPLLPCLRLSISWSGEEKKDFLLESFGRRFGELLPGWRTMNEHLLDLGEEALSLMEEPGLGI